MSRFTLTRWIPGACALGLGVALAAGLTLDRPAHADGSEFTAAQRAQIVSIVRDALKSDPSILADAITSLRAQQEGNAQTKALAYVRANQLAVQSADAQYIRGNPAGRVTVVEYLDPRCPYCRRMEPIVNDLLARDHDVRFVQKLIPILGQDSVLETQAIMAAARQGGAEHLRAALMTDTQHPTIERVHELARAQGLDTARLDADMKSPDVVKTIETNMAQAQGIGLDGTPTFVFGTAGIAPGALSRDDMEAEIAHART